MVNAMPNIEFGIAFNEASGPCLVRYDGNNDELINMAIKNAEKIGAGHIFVIIMRNAFPINVLNEVKNCREVTRVFCATANPLDVLVVENEVGKGIIGVIDGFSVKGVETEEEIDERKKMLIKFGYKR